MGICVIATGGTIGALPYGDLSVAPSVVTIPTDGRNFVRDYFDSIKIEYRLVDAGQCDSVFIDGAYRIKLQLLVDDAEENKIIITHGTNKLLETADFLYHQHQSKVVIITGAMVPLSYGEESDGHDNISFSIDMLNKIDKPGVYIVLHDFIDGRWEPKIYSHKPNEYEKFFDPISSKYNRLILRV